MSSVPTDAPNDHLIRGHDYLALFPDFELVGRKDVLHKLTAILMRKRANNVLLIGTGGVGCSAVCMGLQQSKTRPDTPFDIVSKRFYGFISTAWVFCSSAIYDCQNVNRNCRFFFRYDFCTIST